MRETKVLFVCTSNRLRSPTAEQIFARWPGLDVQSAGTDLRCGNPLSAELVEWADAIVVMEAAHRDKLRRQFRSSLKSARVYCLGIPDDYAFMDPELVRILKARVPALLRLG